MPRHGDGESEGACLEPIVPMNCDLLFRDLRPAHIVAGRAFKRVVAVAAGNVRHPAAMIGMAAALEAQRRWRDRPVPLYPLREIVIHRAASDISINDRK